MVFPKSAGARIAEWAACAACCGIRRRKRAAFPDPILSPFLWPAPPSWRARPAIAKARAGRHGHMPRRLVWPRTCRIDFKHRLQDKPPNLPASYACRPMNTGYTRSARVLRMRPAIVTELTPGAVPGPDRRAILLIETMLSAARPPAPLPLRHPGPCGATFAQTVTPTRYNTGLSLTANVLESASSPHSAGSCHCFQVQPPSASSVSSVSSVSRRLKSRSCPLPSTLPVPFGPAR